MPEVVYFILIFIFGAAVGSFLNVVAYRYNTGLSFWRGDSFCFSCREKLKTIDLLPILSFIFLKGRCRYCGSKLSVGMLATEIVLGCLSVVAAHESGLFGPHIDIYVILNYITLLCIFGMAVLISLYDLKHFIIPDTFLIILLFTTLVFNFLFGHNFSFVANLLTALVLSTPFLVLFVVSKGRWIGLGDIKYIAVIGLFFGFSVGVSSVVLAFWIGATFSLVVLLVQKIIPYNRLLRTSNSLTIKSEVPFGPFLSMAVIIGIIFDLNFFL